MKPRALVVSLLVTSAALWALGILALVPYLVAPAFISAHTVSWVAFVASPLPLWAATRLFCSLGREARGARDGWLLGLVLLLTHVPADWAFMNRFAPALLGEYERLPGPLVYGWFMLIPVAHCRLQLGKRGRDR